MWESIASYLRDLPKPLWLSAPLLIYCFFKNADELSNSSFYFLRAALNTPCSSPAGTLGRGETIRAFYIRSMMTLEELNEAFDFDHPAPVSDKLRMERIVDILKRSRDDAEAYLHLYGEIIPDRGGEGQLASYSETTLVYIDAVSAPFLKSGATIEKETYDSPPMPDPEAR